MANIGMKLLKYAVLSEDETTYGIVKTMGKAISANISINTSEGSLYADDTLAEFETSFQSANVTLTLDDDNDTVFSEILGKTMDTTSGIVSSSINDNSPYIGFGYIVSKVKNNVKTYRAQFFPKIKFKPFIPDANTKGDSITYGTPSIEGTTIANNSGIWEQHVDKTTEAEAITALTAFFVQVTPPIND